MPSSTAIVQGATADDLVAYLATDGVAPNLIGAVVSVTFTEKTSGLVIGPLPCTVDAPAETSGAVRHAWLPEEVAIPGVYFVEIDVVYAGGGVDTFPNDGSSALTIRKKKSAP